jgi:hypothetical protein
MLALPRVISITVRHPGGWDIGWRGQTSAGATGLARGVVRLGGKPHVGTNCWQSRYIFVFDCTGVIVLDGEGKPLAGIATYCCVRRIARPRRYYRAIGERIGRPFGGTLMVAKGMDRTAVHHHNLALRQTVRLSDPRPGAWVSPGAARLVDCEHPGSASLAAAPCDNRCDCRFLCHPRVACPLTLFVMRRAIVR